jgi:hypothetical protein
MKKEKKKLELMKTKISQLTKEMQKCIVGGVNQPTVGNPLTWYPSACCTL